MLKINILSHAQKDPFKAQWDKNRFPETDYLICENSTEDVLWDIVVVYENVKAPTTIKYKEGGLIYFSGEPPMMRPLPDAFIAQFDEAVIPNTSSRHPNKLLSHGFLNWSFGVDFKSKAHRYTFDQLKKLDTPKTKNISIVTSNKKMMPGHNRRLTVIERLKQDFPGQIDFYGAGGNFVDYKADALIPYRFHICMENSAIPYYWTEKFADPLLGRSVPIYYGCKNISDYFDPRGFATFDFGDYASLKALIERILSAPDEVYNSYLPYLEANRTKLMDEINLIPFVISHCRPSETEKSATIYPLQDFPAYHRQMKIIRAKRFLYKMFFPIIEAFTER